MEKEDINKENILKIKKMAIKLDEFSKYIKDANIKEVINWVKSDINEISKIQNELKIRKKIRRAYEMKEITCIKRIQTDKLHKKILEVYQIVNKELNNWRDVSLIV